MVIHNERGKNTHGQGEWVKIPLLPDNVGKMSANNVGPQQGHDTYYLGKLDLDYHGNGSRTIYIFQSFRQSSQIHNFTALITTQAIVLVPQMF